MRRVFLFAGQSNAQGYGARIQLAPVPGWAQTAANGWEGHPTQSSDTGIAYPRPTLANAPSKYLENNAGTTGVVDGWGPFDGCNPSFGYHAGESSSYGPELSFLQKYRAAFPSDAIGALKVVAGGTSIEDWLTGTPGAVLATQIDQAKARLDAAEPGGWQWAGLVWMQGENGPSVYQSVHPTPGAEYKDKLRQFLAGVRARTRPDLPVVVGRVGSHMMADPIIDSQYAADPAYTKDQYRGVVLYTRDQQAQVVADAHTALADTDGLPVLQEPAGNPQWWYHHTGAGYLAMGERFFAAWQVAAGVVAPPPPAPLRIVITGAVTYDGTGTVTKNGSPVGGPGDTIAITTGG
jgi:hypothetical protein